MNINKINYNPFVTLYRLVSKCTPNPLHTFSIFKQRRLNLFQLLHHYNIEMTGGTICKITKKKMSSVNALL